MARKEPIATHVYVYTDTLTFQYANKEHKVRVLEQGAAITPWFDPELPVDLNRYEPLPASQPSLLGFADKKTKLIRDHNILATLRRWRSKLSDDDYLVLMEDLRRLVIYTQAQFREAQLNGRFGDGTGDSVIKKMIASIHIK